ncbi:carbohydrate kinase family protein [Methylomonas rhizoryzae]|uniref:carbohydrate kinase family protein n=1 Tax=Methylomonas rhizoryzae TaxID=2608981 RepID=UPI001231D108|nr:carbohydrate kinase [Methylomonas rhizoryzae]
MAKPALYIFGEVLFDHFPDGSAVLGGAPFNVAWHLQAFGQQPLFISRVGDDGTGKQVKQAMQEWGMNMAGLQTDSVHPTGKVQVDISDGEPGYLIVPEQAYDFIADETLQALPAAGLLYHGSLALRNPVSRQAWERLKAGCTGLVFLDVNLREPWWRKAEVLALAGEADWIKLNHVELAALQADNAPVETAMRRFIDDYRLQGLVVTRGKQGALAMDAGGHQAEVVPAQSMPVVDTVGAGDAFAAVLLLGLQLHWPLSLSLQRAQSFASALVGRRGATVHDPAFYRDFVTEWEI